MKLIEIKYEHANNERVVYIKANSIQEAIVKFNEKCHDRILGVWVDEE